MAPIFHRRLRFTILVVAFALVAAVGADAQYFGRNKVHYEDFDFKVLSTEHFDLHYYPEEAEAARDAARMAERWYERLSSIFSHEFATRKPIILYANQGDFQQTNVVDEAIGEGTGGFTEPLQDRVVLPLTGSYAANDHVIGHELVHAFQYDIVQRSMGREGLQKMNQLPLWFIEGMAEYLSIGRNDPHTSMWMRDIVLQDKIPSIDDISRSRKYFPYRYGQAIWAFIGGKWGDDMVTKLYGYGVVMGWEPAVRRALGISEEELSDQWIASLKAAYGTDVLARTRPGDAGRRLLASDSDAEDMSASPAVSPDGRYVAYLSSLDLFTIDLYLADAQTGTVLKRLLSADASPHMDALRFINSAGSWSPDGKKFVTVVYSNGNDELAIIDVASRDVERRIRFKEIGEVTSPSWSPTGTELAFSGSIGGISDLYTLDLPSGKVKRLTNDRHADMQPVWSPDGTTIAYSTDRGPETDFDRLSYSPMRLALYDLSTGVTTVLPRFASGKNINPQYSPDGRDLFFIGDRDGYSDIYRYALAGGEAVRVTNLATGVSGITAGSPALSVARTSGRLMYSVFEKGNYVIYWSDPPLSTTPANEAITTAGGILPPPSGAGTPIVVGYLADALKGLPDTSGFVDTSYHATLRLVYVGAPTFGASFSSYGTAFVGGISLYFSDMLGYNQLATTIQANGSLADIGGEAQYLYTRSRWNWGVGVGHIPYSSYAVGTRPTTVEIPGRGPVDALAYEEYTQRVYEDRVKLLGAYPFSTTQRFEISTGYTRISYSLDLTSSIIYNNQVINQVDSSLPTPSGLNLLQASTALVGDNTYYGYTSPVRGERYRFEVGGTAGSLKFGTLLLDYRRYFFANPVTFALRGYHYGRYGGDAESDLLTPLFLGYPNNVRGYESSTFDNSECTGGDCPEFQRLLGSRIALASAEVRVPLFGTRGYGLIDFPFFPIDLALFTDGGVAWSSGAGADIRFAERTTARVPVFSSGICARVNLFGYLVAEFFYAYPFQRPDAGKAAGKDRWQWGFQISPGW